MSLLCNAKNLCEQEGYEYTYKMLDEDFTREELEILFQEHFHKSELMVKTLVVTNN